MSSIRISELPLIADINDFDVLVINENNVETKGIELRNFVGSLTGKDLEFTGTITLDDVVIGGDLTVNGETTHNNTVIFNDPIIINDSVQLPPGGFMGLDDLTDVNTQGKQTGNALVYDGGTGLWGAGKSPGLEAVVEDPSPQLGGDLDVLGKKIVSYNNGNIQLETVGDGTVDVLGGGNGSNKTTVRLYDELNRNFIGITVPEATDLISTTTLELPADSGQPGYALLTDGSGKLTWGEVQAGPGGPGGIELTDLSVVTGLPKEGGELTYNNLNGVFTFNPADVAEFLTADDLDSIISIDDLSDVDTTTNAPTSGQALIWNGSDNWVPGDVGKESFSLGELDDVDTDGAETGSILVYDADASEWQVSENVVPSALTYKGTCDLGVDPSAAGNEDVDTNNLVAGFFWVNTGDPATISAGWTGLTGTANGGEYVAYTVDDDYTILGNTGALAPILEIQAGTGIEVDINPDEQKPTISLTDTAVTPQEYVLPTITVDQQGRITSAVANTGAGSLDDVLADYMPKMGGQFYGDVTFGSSVNDSNPQLTLTTTGQAVFKGHVYTGDAADDGIGVNISETNEGVQFNSDDGGNFFRGYNTTSGEFKFNVFADGQVVSPNIKTPLISAEDNTNIEVSPTGTGKFIVKGDNANNVDGSITLNCQVNTHGVTIKSPPHSAGATYTLILPENTGETGQALISDGTGVLSWGDAGANVSTSPSPPTVGVNPGDLWYDTEVGILYVYYKDGTNDSQWVDTRPAGDGEKLDIPSLPPLPA